MNLLFQIHELSTRESTLERFRRINDAPFRNGDLKINININCSFIYTISLYNEYHVHSPKIRAELYEKHVSRLPVK